MALVERDGVLDRAMVHQIEAGQQAGASRAARHAGRDVVGEGHPFGAEPVEIRRLEEGLLAARAQQMRDEIGAPLVDDDQKDVLASHAWPLGVAPSYPPRMTAA